MSSYDDGFEKVRETGVIGSSASTSSGGGASGSATNAALGVENESFGVRAGRVKVTGVVFAVASIGCGASGSATFTVFGVEVYSVCVGAGGGGDTSVAGTGFCGGTLFSTIYFWIEYPPIVIITCRTH